MLFSVVPRIAAYAEAAMLSLITILVWLPAVIKGPTVRLSWTAFFISWAITAAIWVVAQNIPAKKTVEVRELAMK